MLWTQVSRPDRQRWSWLIGDSGLCRDAWLSQTQWIYGTLQLHEDQPLELRYVLFAFQCFRMALLATCLRFLNIIIVRLESLCGCLVSKDFFHKFRFRSFIVSRVLKKSVGASMMVPNWENSGSCVFPFAFLNIISNQAHSNFRVTANHGWVLRLTWGQGIWYQSVPAVANLAYIEILVYKNPMNRYRDV